MWRFVRSIHVHLFLLISLVSLANSAAGQEVYHILHVKGNITLVKTGASIKPGDKVPADAEVKFGTPQSMAAALSTKSGRYMIKPVSSSSGETELSGFLKDIVAAASGKLSTRGGLTNLLDLKNHFRGDYLVLGGHSEIELNEKAFPMGDNTFFYLRYDHEGDTINKKLSHVGTSLVLDRDEIFMVDGMSIDRNSAVMEIFYYHDEWKTSQRIGTIRASFPPDGELITASEILYSNYKEDGMSEDEIESELEAFFQDIYGKVYRPNLHAWVQEHLFDR